MQNETRAMRWFALCFSPALALGFILAVVAAAPGGSSPASAAPAPAPATASAGRLHLMSESLLTEPDQFLTERVAPRQWHATELHVCLSGCAYSSVQAAVDAANEGDLIKIATGVYTDINFRAGITQVIYISKSITIQGGYTMTDWTTPYPITQPTTLDAQEKGRVIYITGVSLADPGASVNATIEGVRMSGGVAVWPDGGSSGYGGGGGICIVSATVALSHNIVISNAWGGGVYLISSTAVLRDNVVVSNTNDPGIGGGVSVEHSQVTLTGNTIQGNRGAMRWGGCGGLRIYASDVTLNNNTVLNNIALFGGGICLQNSTATLRDNTIQDNVAGGWGVSTGGGVDVENSDVTLSSNLIRNNTAGGSFGGGGGGVYLEGGTVVLSNNIIQDNTASGEGEFAEERDGGGGVYLKGGTATLINNIITNNRTNFKGSGALVRASTARFLHNTIARNTGGDGSGVYVTRNSDWEPAVYSTLALTNTILVSHAVGISITAGSTVTLEATLWGSGAWANRSDWSSAGNLTTGTINIWGDPAFVAPGSGDYHIGPGSAVQDAGVDSGLSNDIDGEPRPMGSGYDIGADEYPTGCFARLNDGPIYSTVQAAVDASTRLTDVVKVAGYCSEVSARAGITQVVYINKSVTIRGGYTTTNWTTPYPITRPTTLDAQGKGRVIYITGNINPTIEGLRITGGNAAGLGGDPNRYGTGGGVYVITAAATIKSNQIFSNTAQVGGGVYVFTAPVTLQDNQIFSHTSAWSGAGVYVAESSDVVLCNNIIAANAAWGGGGGLYLEHSHLTLEHNMITTNSSGMSGGGLYLGNSDATLNDNIISNNSVFCSIPRFCDFFGGSGGGLYLVNSPAVLNRNLISGNTSGNSFYGGSGAGLYLLYSPATLNGNTITANIAGLGGGLYLESSDALLVGNLIAGNQVGEEGYSGINSYAGFGGGVYLERSNATLVNNVIADNQADKDGGGLYVAGSSPRLLHTTFARNGGRSGVHTTHFPDWSDPTYSAVILTNTILVSHTVGISVTVGNTATLEGTLWGSGVWANQSDWSGADSIATGTINLWGDPAFVAPGNGDYHIGPGSAARDAGINAGVSSDIDGDPRPMGKGYDIGADEFAEGLHLTKRGAPDPVRAGAQLIYTVRIVNIGNITLTATVTDTLPAHVTPGGILTWTPIITAPGGTWTQQVVVTVESSYAGLLTNVVRVGTVEGASSVYTDTVTVTSIGVMKVYLPLVLRWSP